MSCYYPVKGYLLPGGGITWSPRKGFVDTEVSVSCGRCIGCRLKRSAEWATRLMHESQMHVESKFVTLTYDSKHLPPNGSLVKRDFQLFMKRLRKHFAPRKVLFFHCGEYGDDNRRPHYHAILFNVSFPDAVEYKRNERGEMLFESATLSRLWGLGMSIFGAVTFESAAYVARYCVKKITGQEALEHYKVVNPETGEISWLQPEYATMSLKDGIGKSWFKKYRSELNDNDSVIMRGKEMPVPRYYDKLRLEMEMVEAKRKRRRKLNKAVVAGETRPSRVKVKEKVQKAKMNLLKRKL